MNTILFASSMNPLSAIAARYLNDQNILKLIVIAKSRPESQGGFIHLFSQIGVGFYRYFHVFLRIIKVKRSKNYCSLAEFISANPNIPKIYCQSDSLGSMLDDKLKDLGLKECLALSCIFPFKLSFSSSRIKRSLNIHPGELPANRGPNPYFWVLVNKNITSAVTYHKLTSEIDKGSILLSEIFSISSDYSEYKLEKIASQYLERSLPVFFEQFQELWDGAKSQEGGCYYKQPSSADRKKYKRHLVFNMRDFFNKQASV